MIRYNRLQSTFLVIVVIIFGLAFGNLPRLIPIFIVLISLYFYVTKATTYLFTLFLVLLPLREFVDAAYMIPGSIHAIYVPSFLSMISILRQKEKDKKYKQLSNTIQYLVLFLLAYWIYVNYKNVFYNIDLNAIRGDESTLSYIKATRRAIKYLFFFLPLYFFPTRINDKKLLEIMRTVLTTIILILFISQIFTETLVGNLREDGPEFVAGEIIRSAGLLAYGDANSLGAVYVLLTGLFFYININFNIKIFSKYLIIPLVVGVFYTLSRGAIIGLFFVFLISYLEASGASKLKFALILSFCFVVFLIILPSIMELKVIESTVNRFSMIESSELDTGENTKRIGGWIFYIESIFANPIVFITGTDAALLTSRTGYARVPHNIYLTILFNGGLVFLISYLMIIFKKLTSSKVVRKNFRIIFYPYILMTFLLSDFAVVIMLIYVLIAILSVQKAYSQET